MVGAQLEQPFWAGDTHVVGVDEAGRGALAGPVVAAAVVLNPRLVPNGLDDSKKLSPLKRERLYHEVAESALSYGIGIISSERIDEVNILHATFDAMHIAIDVCRSKLETRIAAPSPLHLLIDGNRFRAHSIPHTTVVRGDATSVSIAAASILAKVTRDAIMVELDAQFPEYHFAIHKGYGTARHAEAIRKYGISGVHRSSFLRSFAP